MARAHHLLAGRGLRGQRRQDRRGRHQVAAFFGSAQPSDFDVDDESVELGRRPGRLGPAADDPALRASLRRGGRRRRLPDRLGAARPHAGALGASTLSGGRRSSSTSPPTCAAILGPGTRSATPPTGRSISGTIRGRLGRRASSTSIRSGPTPRSTSSASTTTCRCRTGATARAISTRRAADAIYDLDYLRGEYRGRRGLRLVLCQRRRPRRPGPHADHRRRRRQALGLPLQGFRAWWSNPHRNRPGGVESGAPTAWVPESKPIWLHRDRLPGGRPAARTSRTSSTTRNRPRASCRTSPAAGATTPCSARYLEALLRLLGRRRRNNPLSPVYRRPDGRPRRAVSGLGTRGPIPAFPARGESGPTAPTGGSATG